jgi:hypothetical protein
MRRGAAHVWVLLALVVWAAPALGQTARIGWPEAVSRLAEERSTAELCVASLKRYGNQEQIAQGRLAYGTAKADFDGVIAGLVIALAEGGNPDSLPSLDAKLAHGATGLGQFCKTVSEVMPAASGQKGILDEMVKASVDPVIKALSEGVAALYNNHRNDDVLTRQTTLLHGSVVRRRGSDGVSGPRF